METISLNDWLQFGSLVVAIIALIITVLYSRKTIKVALDTAMQQNKLQMFAEYTHRYQDIFSTMPNEVYAGEIPMSDITALRYMRLYFDLCSEEYHLWRQGQIPEDVWELWKEGMQIATRKKHYRDAWILLKGEYYNDFETYFQREVIDYDINKNK